MRVCRELRGARPIYVSYSITLHFQIKHPAVARFQLPS